MAFKKMIRPKYPPRLWSLVGYPGSGKSTFAAQLRGPILVVDADQRFSEVLDDTDNEVFELSETKADNVSPDRITELLNKNMPSTDVGTIVVDSLTAIITPLVVQAMIDREEGRNKNLSAGFKNKALAMRQIQDAVTRWGTDVLWIYHLQKSRDEKAKEIERATVTQTELSRLTRSINANMQIVQEGDKRGIHVVWARRGRSGMTIWDDSGMWKGMPDKLEAAMYDGLSKAEQDALEQSTPMTFTGPEHAISWAVEQGAYDTVEKARAAYERVKREGKPRNAKEMAALWVEDATTAIAAAAGLAPPPPEAAAPEQEDDAVF